MKKKGVGLVVVGLPAIKDRLRAYHFGKNLDYTSIF
jgi:hypothetical protein